MKTKILITQKRLTNLLKKAFEAGEQSGRNDTINEEYNSDHLVISFDDFKNQSKIKELR